MLRFIISTCIICGLFWGNAQEKSKTIDLNPKDTTVYKQTYGLRVGVDLSRLLATAFDEDYQGLEFVGDWRLSNKLYIAGELGNEKKTIQENLYEFTSSGSYFKVGVDYNTYGNWYGEQNMITLGGRFAISNFTQSVNDYQLFDSNRYWSADDFVSGVGGPIEFSGRTKSWLEGVVGVKMELFNNLYLGGSVRLGLLLSDPKDEGMWSLFIPGFNKVTDNSRFGVGYNYSLSYLIPLYKKAKKTEALPVPEE